MRPFLIWRYGTDLRAAGPCYTAFAGPVVIACAGLAHCWPGRAQAWSLMSEQLPRYRKSVHKAVKRFLQTVTVRRVELTVNPDVPRMVAWARRLGFVYESTMPYYGPAGELHDMYVRIR